MERYSNGLDCVKRKLEVISKKLTQKTDPTEGIPHMSGNGGLNIWKIMESFIFELFYTILYLVHHLTYYSITNKY